MLWDVFCRVIDNHGDIGVCWRLAVALARRGEQVRLRVDDASALAWMAPGGQPHVEVLPWAAEPGPGDVVVEAFGCELPLAFQALMAATKPQPPWINLEYLTAESFAERNHGLRSPVLAGPGAGCTKHFFYPGFTPRTGGLLRDFEPAGAAGHAGGALHVSMFCYEPPAMGALLEQLARWPGPVRLQVTAGRATAAVRAVLGERTGSGSLSVDYLPVMPQPAFDALLRSCDLNFVRGEDSLVGALWAGRPFVWQLYPQDDGAHHAKLEAFLDWLDAPSSLRAFHRGWNGVDPTLPALAPQEWRDTVAAARARLLLQDDLPAQLLRFVRQLANTSSAGA